MNPTREPETAMRWQLLPALSASGFDPTTLFDGQRLRLDEWLADGSATVLKQGPHRAVFRVQLPGLDCIVKRHPVTTRSGLRALLRGRGAAERECDQARAVASRGVPTVEPLAYGEPMSRSGHGYLLLRTLPAVRPLGSFLELELPSFPAARRERLRCTIADALGRFLALMHDAGIEHADLHPDNLLLTLSADDQPSFHLVDLLAVRLRSPLSWRQARANLAIFQRWFMLRVGRVDRLRFWLAYQSARTTPGWADEVGAGAAAPADRVRRLAVRQIERHGLRSNLAFWRTAERRILATSRYFRAVRAPGILGHVVADLDANVVAEFLADPDAPFRRADCVVLKDSPSSKVIEFDLVTSAGTRRVIYKRFEVTCWTAPLRALARRTPTFRSFEMGHGLRFRGLPTPRPLGAWHRLGHGLPREGYLLTEKVPGALDLAAFLERVRRLPPVVGRRILRRAIDRVARLVADLHHRRVSHRDLKSANLLMSPAQWSLARAERQRRAGELPDGDHGVLDTAEALAAAQVWLIDLVGVHRHGKLPRHRRIQNLARLNASFVHEPLLTRTDRLRFLRVYLQWGLRGRFGWKRWWQQIETATAAKVRRNEARGRPLG